MQVKNNKLLLITPRLYNYQDEIYLSLEKMGYDVTVYDEVLSNRFYTFFRDKTFSPLNKYFDRRYFASILDSIQLDEFHTFLLIQGGWISDDFIITLRKKLPNAKFYMYQWDSLVHNDYKSKIKYFDYIYSFDENDAQKLNIDYLPLFYTQGYAEIADVFDNIEYDLVFYGTYHSDRLEMIKQIDKICIDKKIKLYYHLYAGRISLIVLYLKGKIALDDFKYFKTYTEPMNKIVDRYSRTKGVLDIEKTNQTGLTIRTLEALGSNRKLVTTNENIKKSELYNDKNIFVIDRDNLSINKDFIDTKNEFSDKIRNYHIEDWLKNILRYDMINTTS